MSYVISQYSYHADAFQLRGNARCYSEDYTEAIQDYSSALLIDPKAKKAYNNRGNVYRKQNKFNLAIRDYSAAIELDSLYGLAFLNRAYTFHVIHKNRLAMKDYNYAQYLMPDNALVYYNKGLIFMENGDTLRSCQSLYQSSALGYENARKAYALYCLRDE